MFAILNISEDDATIVAFNGQYLIFETEEAAEKTFSALPNTIDLIVAEVDEFEDVVEEDD